MMIAAKVTPGKPAPRCTFCGRSADEVDIMVTSPLPAAHRAKPCICNECIAEANKALADAKEAGETTSEPDPEPMP